MPPCSHFTNKKCNKSIELYTIYGNKYIQDKISNHSILKANKILVGKIIAID